MTTFQDPQPQSRRAMRASERGETVEPTNGNNTNDSAGQPAPFVAPIPLVEPEVKSPQFTSPVPSFDPEQFRSRAEARENAPLAATQALPKVEQPNYQPRDFAPQSSVPAESVPVESVPVEASPFVTPPVNDTLASAAPPAADTVHAYEAPPVGNTSSSEHTMTRRELRALREAGASAPVAEAPAAAVQAPPVAAAPVAAPSESVVAPAAWDQPPAAAPYSRPAAPSAPMASTEAPITPPPASEQPASTVEPQAWPFGGLLTPSTDQPAEAPVEAAPVDAAPVDAAGEEHVEATADETSASPFSFFRRKRAAKDEVAEPTVAQVPDPEPEVAVVAELVEPQSAPEAHAPVAAEAAVNDPMPAVPHAAAPAAEASNNEATPALSPFDALFTPKSAASADSMPATQAWSAPVGHWSTQADLDDESQPYENTINRTVGTSSSATNALVLPSIPVGSDIRGPLTENGQITLTGSIDLSHSLSSTGSTDRLENTGMDALFELHDAEAISTDSAPVRAIRAVSTHNTGHGVTHTQKPKGNRALTGLLIAASSMAVVVAGLLVAALAFNLF